MCSPASLSGGLTSAKGARGGARPIGARCAVLGDSELAGPEACAGPGACAGLLPAGLELIILHLQQLCLCTLAPHSEAQLPQGYLSNEQVKCRFPHLIETV